MIHDLGGGSGAMGRWLAPRLPGPQHWVVHDRDADLLDCVADAGRPPTAAVTVEARRSDITRLAPGDLAGASLVAASALLDLLTADELAADARRLQPGCPHAARADRRRPRRPDPGGSAGRAHRPPRSTPTSAAAAALLGPDAVAAAVDALRGRAPRSSSGRAPGASMRPTPT